MTEKSKTRKATAQIPPFGLRMQSDLKAKLEMLAKQNSRSLNLEITLRLEKSLGDIPDKNNKFKLISTPLEYLVLSHIYSEEEKRNLYLSMQFDEREKWITKSVNNVKKALKEAAREMEKTSPSQNTTPNKKDR